MHRLNVILLMASWFTSVTYGADIVLIFDVVGEEIPFYKICSQKDDEARDATHVRDNVYLKAALSPKKCLVESILNRVFTPTILTEEQAKEIFNKIKNPIDPLLKIIDWQHRTNGCNRRVYQLSRWLRTQNIHNEEIELRGANLSLRTKKKPFFFWEFHNAIVLWVADMTQSVRKMVVDLALSPDALVLLADWLTLMESEMPAREPLTVTSPGHPHGSSVTSRTVIIQPSPFDEFWDYSALMKDLLAEFIEEEETVLAMARQ